MVNNFHHHEQENEKNPNWTRMRSGRSLWRFKKSSKNYQRKLCASSRGPTSRGARTRHDEVNANTRQVSCLRARSKEAGIERTKYWTRERSVGCNRKIVRIKYVLLCHRPQVDLIMPSARCSGSDCPTKSGWFFFRSIQLTGPAALRCALKLLSNGLPRWTGTSPVCNEAILHHRYHSKLDFLDWGSMRARELVHLAGRDSSMR